MVRSIWMTYDLGIKGDYQALYRWLDNHSAIECGLNTAFFKYTYKMDAIIELKEELLDAILFSSNDRVYIIIKKDDNSTTIGKFIIGNRKANPWEGYGNLHTDTKVDE